MKTRSAPVPRHSNRRIFASDVWTRGTAATPLPPYVPTSLPPESSAHQRRMPLRTVTPRCTASQVRGLFMASPPSEFTDQVASYGEQCKALTKFLDDLEKHAGADVATKARRSIVWWWACCW